MSARDCPCCRRPPPLRQASRQRETGRVTLRSSGRHMRRMRNTIRFTAAAVLLAIGACKSDKVTSPYATAVDVYTAGSVFTPFTADVAVGGTVHFHMTRAPDGFGHNATFDHTVAGAPADVTIVVDSTVDRVFTTKGTFEYNCTVH